MRQGGGVVGIQPYTSILTQVNNYVAPVKSTPVFITVNCQWIWHFTLCRIKGISISRQKLRDMNNKRRMFASNHLTLADSKSGWNHISNLLNENPPLDILCQVQLAIFRFFLKFMRGFHENFEPGFMVKNWPDVLTIWILLQTLRMDTGLKMTLTTWWRSVCLLRAYAPWRLGSWAVSRYDHLPTTPVHRPLACYVA